MSRVNEANPPAYNFTIKFLSAMKPIQAILWVVMLFCMVGLHAQTNQWTWVAGDNITVNVSNYGTIGVAAATNHPGPRSESTICTDKFGNLWLFGGKGKDVNGTEGLLNDLWKWDGTNWTWVKGDSAKGLPSYGTLSLPAGSNTPGARSYAVGWNDNNGNLWLFGGYGARTSGAGRLNDVWKWDGVNWTWMKGYNDPKDSVGVHGIKGITDPKNNPAGRFDATVMKDKNGIVWMFGGNTFFSSIKILNCIYYFYLNSVKKKVKVLLLLDFG